MDKKEKLIIKLRKENKRLRKEKKFWERMHWEKEFENQDLYYEKNKWKWLCILNLCTLILTTIASFVYL